MQCTIKPDAEATPRKGALGGIYELETSLHLASWDVSWSVSGYIWAHTYRVQALNSIEATKEAIARFTASLPNPAESPYWVARLHIRSVVQLPE